MEFSDQLHAPIPLQYPVRMSLGRRAGLNVSAKRETAAPTGNRTSVVQPVASRRSDWAVLAHSDDRATDIYIVKLAFLSYRPQNMGYTAPWRNVFGWTLGVLQSVWKLADVETWLVPYTHINVTHYEMYNVMVFFKSLQARKHRRAKNQCRQLREYFKCDWLLIPPPFSFALLWSVLQLSLGGDWQLHYITSWYWT